MTKTEHAIDVSGVRSEKRIPALAVSRGIGIGRIAFLHGKTRQFFRLDLDPEQTNVELQRFQSALETSILQLRELSSGSDHRQSQPLSGIFGVHLLILESTFTDRIRTMIKQERVNSEWAIRTISDEYIEKQEGVADDRFRDKSLDIGDVADRLIAALGHSHENNGDESGKVIVARDLSPSAIVELAQSRPAAIITEQGGWTSHSSILAREFRVPMVSGVRNFEQLALLDELVIVDGINGEVIIKPSEETVRVFADLSEMNELVVPAVKGGTVIAEGSCLIRANADQSDAYLLAKTNGARGIGLFRSESLIRQPGRLPTEDEQFDAYCRIADTAGQDVVRIRTFDVGVEHFGSSAHWVENNPALGLRAIRLSLADPKQFRIQIRAILRAAFDRNIDIILPMISSVSEIVRAKAIIVEEKDGLTRAGIRTGDPQIGVMIETPAAVLTASEIAARVDFLCLGTNDLVQYLLAVDRDNEALADWYQTLHPAVIRAVGDVVQAANNAGVPVTVCGEMAGSPFYVPILLGLGARELSMNVNSVQSVSHLLAGISMSDAINLTANIRSLTTADEIEAYIREYYRQNWPDLFPKGFLDQRHH